MKSSLGIVDLLGPGSLPGDAGHTACMLELLPKIAAAHSAESAVELFQKSLRMIGADSGVFLSATKDDAVRTSVRSLLACDPNWAIEYSQLGWPAGDPWLRYAADSATPIRGSELDLRPGEADLADKAARLGFASAAIVPAPTNFGSAQFGVLVLGSNSPGFFDGEGWQLLRIVARALAMELHDWLLRAVRDDLLERSQIKPQEIALLRHEAGGLTSKMIAAELGINPKAVDRRFQRVCEKLDAPDRRIAARIARLYDLL
jgi:DNA-binding CsgD family transcriptional regulator